MGKFLGNIFIISSMIPWLGFKFLDTQPFPIIFAFIFLLSQLIYPNIKIKIDYIFHITIIIFLSLIYIILIENKYDFLLVRGLGNYLSIPIFLYAYDIFIKRYGFPLQIIIIINICYILVGILQYFGLDLTSALIASRTTSLRGVTSLTTEPTFYGIYLFFISWIYYSKYSGDIPNFIYYIILCNIIAIVFLAQSSMIILYLLIGAILYFSKSRNIKLLIKYFILLIAGLLLIPFLDGLFESRVLIFINYLISNPLAFFSDDASANQRLSHVILPIYASYLKFFMPGGFHGFIIDVESAAISFNNYFYFSYVGDKIMSWIGSLVYELGVSGIVVIILLIFNIYKKSSSFLFEKMLFFLILFSAIPVAFPLTYMLYVLMIKTNKNIKK